MNFKNPKCRKAGSDSDHRVAAIPEMIRTRLTEAAKVAVLNRRLNKIYTLIKNFYWNYSYITLLLKHSPDFVKFLQNPAL
jgi:hypothetical protein